MPVERVAEFKILVEHRVAFVPAELLGPGRVDAAIHAGGERAALEAVAADLVAVETSLAGAGLDDPCHGAGIDCPGADHGGGAGAFARLLPRRWNKDAAEHRARGDVRRLLPAPQRPYRAELGGAVRDGHGDAAAGAVALRAGRGQAQAALAHLDVLDPDRRQLGAAQRAGEADQQQGAVAQPGEAVGDAGQDLA